MEFNEPLLAVFIFAIGACVGSFLNVVAWRMPRGESLVTPPSACPKCHHRLAAFDNIPVFGWLLLRGKCRYCKLPISPRYPLVELATGLLFAGHYWLLFRDGWGPYEIQQVRTIYGTMMPSMRTLTLDHDWPILVLHLWLIGSLIAASLIDLEHYIIPLEICWLVAVVGAIGHALGRPAGSIGNLHFDPVWQAVSLAAGAGLLVSIGLLRFGLLKRSFADDAPLLEMELAQLPEDERPDPWPPARIRTEMRREIAFVLIPMVFAAIAAGLVLKVPAVASMGSRVAAEPHVAGFLGSLLGGLVGGFVVWAVRILGSYGFGREAMGLGDVHLMFAVGCVLGPGPATVAFFIAPAFGLTIAAVQLFVRGKREIPYGPFLSLATYAVMLFYTPIASYLSPGFEGLMWALQTMISASAAFIAGGLFVLVGSAWVVWSAVRGGNA